MNKISILGIGWINSTEYGCIMTGQRTAYTDKLKLKKEIFSVSYRNFGRIDNASKMTCYAAALALNDAGIEYSPENKQDIGIVGANHLGSLETDAHYFKDYVDSKRTLARGNLFVYTLPTSPLGEAAMRFGLQGPLLYIASADNSLLSVINTAEDMVLFNESPVIMAGLTLEHEAVYFVLKIKARSGQKMLCTVNDIKTIIEKDLSFDVMIREFSLFRKDNGQS